MMEVFLNRGGKENLRMIGRKKETSFVVVEKIIFLIQLFTPILKINTMEKLQKEQFWKHKQNKTSKRAFRISHKLVKEKHSKLMNKKS